GDARLLAVAPGISEALITTAAGLFAAIPAVIAYNQFTHRMREFGARMDDFSMEILNFIERTTGVTTGGRLWHSPPRPAARKRLCQKSTSRRLSTWCWCCSSSLW